MVNSNEGLHHTFAFRPISSLPMPLSSQDVARYFGPFRPDKNTNARHKALLRKALEFYTIEELRLLLNQLTKLKVSMGSGPAANELGKIKTHRVCIHFSCHRHRTLTHSHQMIGTRQVYPETPTPTPAQQTAMRDFLAAYDAYYKRQGNDYVVRIPQNRSVLQAAEQRWHDRMVLELVARGRPGRPAWALEPLPGLERVRVAPVPAPAAIPRAIAPAPRRYTQLAPPSAISSVPTRVASRIRPTRHQDEAPPHPQTPQKRAIVHLGTVDISDDEDARPPRKKQRRVIHDDDARPQKRVIIDLSN